MHFWARTHWQQTTPGPCDKGEGTRVRRLREVSSREAAESRTREPVTRGMLTEGKFLKIGMSTLRLPVVETGVAEARQDPRTPRNRRSAVRAVLRSEDIVSVRKAGTAHGDLLELLPQPPAASASRRRPDPRTALVVRNLKESG